jgi:dipeptidyl aminopeptidase/acylaminoacyl peptidase
VTLLGAVTQHAAECLSGITIHQLAHAGSPIVWGGAPAIFEMRKGGTPYGAIETAMIDSSYAQVGKSLGLPTHTYLGATDSKVLDMQAGIESNMGFLVGALSGINMISGAGMIDSLLCQSPEKLVIDAEGISMAKRLLEGMKIQSETLATEFFEGVNFKGGDFLKQKVTMQLFQKEQHLPTKIIDRDSIRGWKASGSLDTFHDVSAITSGPGGKFNPRYSPDGSHLAYVLDIVGSESYHLVVHDFTTNQYTDLTPDIFHALQPNFCWSPDGSQLAVLSDERGHFSAYIIPVSGGKPQLVLDTGHPAWQVEWSPGGRHLAVSCEMHGQDYGIFIVNLETKEITMLCHPERQRHLHRTQVQVRVSDNNEEILRPYGAQNDMINAHEPKWSPDGSKLAFHSDQHGWFDIGVYDLETKEIEWVTQNEGDSQTPVFNSNESMGVSNLQLAYTQSKGAVNWIETLRLRSASLPIGYDVSARKYQIGKGIHSGNRLTSDAKRIVTTFSSPGQPPDLWMIDLESGKSIQLTNSLPKELMDEEFVTPEEIEYPGMDGTLIPALLYRPKQKPALAVVMIHGGPNWHYSAEWNPVMAHLASRGYAVLCPNYRGSTGYGREWQYAAQFDMGGVDTCDVAAGARYLLREGLASKVAVTGRSHGGYLTMTCLTQFPELWCAGSAVVPFTNWFKSHEDSREDLQHWNIENMGAPEEYAAIKVLIR